MSERLGWGIDPNRTMPSFASFFMGGFECSTHKRKDGKRLDLQAATNHDRFAEKDFEALRSLGIQSHRDGLRWHLIEARAGVYDWTSCDAVLNAARKSGCDITWDLCHYGWPDWLNVWSDEFPERFAAFAEATAVRIIENGLPSKFCLINEISFLAWAAGEVGHFFPAEKGRGADLKRQLCRAAIAGARSIRRVAPDATLVSSEPLIHVMTHSRSRTTQAAAEERDASQHEAVDCLLGRQNSEFGGDGSLLDVVGLNFYPANQWILNGCTIPFGHHHYRPLRDLLREAYERHRKPLLISETGAEGSCRSSWLHYVCGEVDAARTSGIPVLGICIYPILEYPGWDDDRNCAVGLLSMASASGDRTINAELASELRAQQRTHPVVPARTRPGFARA